MKDFIGRTGTYMWTASSAGWLVIFIKTDLPQAFFASVGCVAIALVWGYATSDQ